MGYKGDVNSLKKECIKCGKKVRLLDFYQNKDWVEEFNKDTWCKVCANKYAVSKKSLQSYCKFNRRVFMEDLWDWAFDLAESFYQDDEKFKKTRDVVKKNRMILSKAIKSYFKRMNNAQYYKFSDSHEGDSITNNSGRNHAEKSYNQKWLGFYTDSELTYLNDYLHGLQRDFKLENSAYMDYAKKVCKASLIMDKAFSDMLDGKAGSERKYKDFKDIFDQLSQSAKFAEKTRSENDAVGLGSLGEVIKKMESTGFLQTKISFEKDDIDKIADDFRWTLSSIGEDF